MVAALEGVAQTTVDLLSAALRLPLRLLFRGVSLLKKSRAMAARRPSQDTRGITACQALHSGRSN